MKKNQSMVDVVEEYLRSDKTPRTLNEIVDYVAKEKTFDANDIEKINQLYLDISTSGKYVYIGENQWDLKERNLEYWDKDGIAFMSEEERENIREEDYEDLDFSEFDREEFIKKLNAMSDDELDEEIELDLSDEELVEQAEEAEYLEVELPTHTSDDDKELSIDDVDFDLDDEDDEDEDKYNEAMDDYEYLYDE